MTDLIPYPAVSRKAQSLCFPVACVLACLVLSCFWGGSARAADSFKDALEKDFYKVDIYRAGEKKLEPVELDTMGRTRAVLSHDPARVTLINFWASWCAVCAVDLPNFRALQQSRSDIRFMYVGENKDGFEAIDEMATRLGLPGTDSFYDSRSFMKRWLDVRTFPTTIIVAPSGDILYRLEGDGDWRSEYMKNFLDSLVARFPAVPQTKVSKP